MHDAITYIFYATFFIAACVCLAVGIFSFVMAVLTMYGMLKSKFKKLKRMSH